MRARARRRRGASRLGRSVAATAILVVGLMLSWAFASVTIQENALARSIDELHGQIAAEQARNAQLQAALAEKKGTDYIVERAKQLGWVWPWEALIAVQRDASSRDGASTGGERPSRIARWVALFVGTR